jgi:ABC-type transport system involved in multi-copper enzyme maturation permease subunit
MLHLIKLEWKKHTMGRYIKGFIFCTLGIYGFITLIALSSKNDIDAAIISFQELMSIITIFSNIVFIIFGSVILSRIIISEFRSKTMQVLFTYPIRRKKLLLAKIILAYLCIVGSLFFSALLMQMSTYFLQPSLGFFEGTVTLHEIFAVFPKTVTNAFMMGAIALIPLFFGMRKKSTATTITSAVIIGFLINSTISNGNETFSLANVVFVPLLLALIGFSIAYAAIHKIDVKDVA